MMTENMICDLQADILIDSLQKKFAERRIAKTILQNKSYDGLLTLNITQLDFCIQFIKSLTLSSRVDILTDIVDHFTDQELRNENLKVIFSNFKNDLKAIKTASV